MKRYLLEGLTRAEVEALHRAIGAAPLSLFAEPDVATAAATLYGRARRVLDQNPLRRGWEEGVGVQGEPQPDSSQEES